MVDKHKEANVVRQIWESAIRKNEKAVLPIYIDFLQNFPEAPDVESADILLTDTTKTLIWRDLLARQRVKFSITVKSLMLRLVHHQMLDFNYA